MRGADGSGADEPHRGHSIAAAALQTLATALEVAVAPPPTPVPAFAPRTAEDAVVAKVLQYIWNHSQRPINVADVVAQLPVTRRPWNGVFATPWAARSSTRL